MLFRLGNEYSAPVDGGSYSSLVAAAAAVRWPSDTSGRYTTRSQTSRLA